MSRRPKHRSTIPADTAARSDAKDEHRKPPADLPVNPAVFWSAAADLDDLAPPVEVDSTPALKRLGPLPFPRGGFPLMGFLTTVYEHVVQHISCGAPRESGPPR